MKKIFALVILFALFLVVAQVSTAVMPNQTQVVNSNSQKTLTIPSNAVEIAPNVFSIGSAFDPGTGKVVDGFMIVHKKKQSGKISGQSRKPGGAVCYGFLATGAKWKSVEPWLVNPANAASISGSQVLSIMQGGVSKWEDATDGVVNSSSSYDVLGNGSLTNTTLIADSVSPDNVNEVYFGSIADSGTIAVTTVWGYFSGPAASRRLVEWDMVFDDVDFGWSTTGDLNKMDLENISTHELGHAVGLADLYNASCSDETMYGYASEGETNKQTLETGDLQGMNSLY